jgi:hypothetical protein
MPQLHCYVSEPLAKKVQQRAQAAGLSTSRYIAELLKREVEAGWPDGFFEEVVGSWQGERLERAAQGQFESREPFAPQKPEF